MSKKVKSFTSLEQSKKLADILPVESADMIYLYWKNRTRQTGIDTIPIIRESLPIKKCDIPCWSLAALLDVLPNYETNNFGDSIQLAVKNKALVTDEGETLLDLVVNMIIYLHELNLL